MWPQSVSKLHQQCNACWLQAVDDTPRRDAAQQQQAETPSESARRKTSFFQRLSPLLGRKEGAGSQEVRCLQDQYRHF